jgi:hypothetical protein
MYVSTIQKEYTKEGVCRISKVYDVEECFTVLSRISRSRLLKKKVSRVPDFFGKNLCQRNSADLAPF